LACACCRGGIERSRIEREEYLSLLHVFTFAEVHRHQRASNLRANGDRGESLHGADPADVEPHRLSHRYRDVDRYAVVGSGLCRVFLRCFA
jgi:hypothetical protein